MLSTATHVAWSVYVSVYCRVTSVIPAKKRLNRSRCRLLWIRKAQGTVLDRARISHEKSTFWEIVILGHIQTCNTCGRYSQPYSQSGSNNVASGYDFYWPKHGSCPRLGDQHKHACQEWTEITKLIELRLLSTK